MATKAEVVAAIDAAKVLAEALPEDQAAVIAQLQQDLATRTQERDTALGNLATLKSESLTLLNELTTADAAEDAKRQALRAKLEE